jgi:hypothetical protein
LRALRAPPVLRAPPAMRPGSTSAARLQCACLDDITFPRSNRAAVAPQSASGAARLILQLR